MQPCGAKKHPSPQKCDLRSPTRSVHLGALAQGRRQQSTTVRLCSRHDNHSCSLAHPPLSPPSPRAPLYPRALWQCSRSSRLLSAPCQPRDCQAFALALESEPGTHTSALSRLSTLQKGHGQVGSGWLFGVAQGQGRAGSAHGVPNGTAGFTSTNPVHRGGERLS